jgi:lycopene cyclase domain-containing protein
MTYSTLAVVAVVAAIALDLVVLGTRMVLSRPFWVSYAIMLAFQVIVDGLLAGVPVVRYRASAVVGWRVAYAPVEDVLFGFALVLWTLAAWTWLGRRMSDADRAAQAATSPRPPIQARRADPTETRPENTS